MPTITDLNEQLMISVYLRRDVHENGMTLQEYADAIIAGTHPVLEHDEFVYQFGSIRDELVLVEEWAVANGLTVTESSEGSATIKLTGLAGQFNNLFNIQLNTVIDGDRTYVTHSGDLTIPSDINSVVELVLGLDNSLRFSSNSHLDTSDIPFDPNVTIGSPTPVDLSKAYKFPRSPGTNQVQGLGACVAIIELGGGYTTQNLTSTFSRIGLSNPTVVDVSVDGGTNSPAVYDIGGANGEVMLDIYCVGSVAPGAKQVIYFAPNSYQGFIDSIIAPINDTVNNPSVISVSWGTIDTNWTTPNRNAFENALAAAVAKGITVFVAAGDYGTKAISSSAYGTVQYPGTSPYVVSCGGTVITVNTDYTINTERAWGGVLDNGFAGGGGVSSIFSLPAWQSGRGYTTSTYTGTTMSLARRGIPDVSAMARGYTLYWYDYTTLTPTANRLSTFLGTSAVAPLLSGLMARLNSLSGRIIGFVNTDWYAAQSTAFNDITTGANTLSTATSGYSATISWDACTGLGTPIGTELYKLYKLGSTFPKANYGFSPTTNAVYPRPASIRTS